MAAATRGSLLLDAFVNIPILGSTRRVLGSTGVLIPLTLYLDTIFGDVNPTGVTSDFYTKYSEYYTDYSDQYHLSGEKNSKEYPKGYSSYSQVNNRYSRSSWVPGMTYASHPQVVIGNHRSLADDQKVIYEQLSTALSASGVDGRGCLLKFICEAQHTRIKKLNLLGKMLATLLTPKEDSFLEEYNQAASLGKADECGGNFDTCPISLFNIFNFSRTSKPSKDSKAFTKDENFLQSPNIK